MRTETLTALRFTFAEACLATRGQTGEPGSCQVMSLEHVGSAMRTPSRLTLAMSMWVPCDLKGHAIRKPCIMAHGTARAAVSTRERIHGECRRLQHATDGQCGLQQALASDHKPLRQDSRLRRTLTASNSFRRSSATELRMHENTPPPPIHPPICLTLNMVVVLFYSYRFTELWDCMI